MYLGMDLQSKRAARSKKINTPPFRTHLEYANNSVWNPYNKEVIENLEKAQIRATKLVYSIKHLDCEKRLRALKLPT
jgi:hypothetical protein